MRRLLTLGLAAFALSCAGSQNPPGPSGHGPEPLPPTATPPALPPVTPSASTGAPLEHAFATVAGTVTYRQRIALTPEAIVQVELRDVSRQDAEAPLIAKQLIQKPGQVPIPFSISYDPSLIEPGRDYAVSARITDRGQLQFVTDARIPALAAASPTPLEIVVVPVR